MTAPIRRPFPHQKNKNHGNFFAVIRKHKSRAKCFSFIIVIGRKRGSNNIFLEYSVLCLLPYMVVTILMGEKKEKKKSQHALKTCDPAQK